MIKQIKDFPNTCVANVLKPQSLKRQDFSFYFLSVYYKDVVCQENPNKAFSVLENIEF